MSTSLFSVFVIFWGFTWNFVYVQRHFYVLVLFFVILFLVVFVIFQIFLFVKSVYIVALILLG